MDMIGERLGLIDTWAGLPQTVNGHERSEDLRNTRQESLEPAEGFKSLETSYTWEDSENSKNEETMILMEKNPFWSLTTE